VISRFLDFSISRIPRVERSRKARSRDASFERVVGKESVTEYISNKY
jgi:hypothetical protein